jgi:hypothetical protein
MSIAKTVGPILFSANSLAYAMNVHAAPGSAEPAQADHHLGDHPAVVVQRLHAQQGFDYASTFYPHPAWLFLRTEAEHPTVAEPAVQRGL